MAIRFSETARRFGLDTRVSPAWQMVPLHGPRVLKLTGAKGLIPRAADPAIVSASQSAVKGTTLLTLVGLKAGTTTIEWVPSATHSGPMPADMQLEVSVKEMATLDTAFFYVDDGRKQKTRRVVTDLNHLIAKTNEILFPQANLFLKRRSGAVLPVSVDLGKVVRFSSHLPGVAARQHEWDDLEKLRDRKADFTVFFVREYEQDSSPLRDDDEAGTIASDKMCIFEDKMAYDAWETLAHEIGHLFGWKKHTKTRGHLMIGAGSGRRIDKKLANMMNKSGA